ncbi:putative Beta-1,3-galactosyltransferase 1 [Hypsibius exemplaris]|uniref:Beta-1,3-galactosyltransferase 1 n=1 Tax=Hypsibius exemplaris TaxID=2072580 RepID=A0A1W0WA21_HYPEX|nr:putative Beta-1,3-galactosyltransferase 1 [Hypsibius exemplaris]
MFHIHEYLLKPRSTQAVIRQLRAVTAISVVACIFVLTSSSTHRIGTQQVIVESSIVGRNFPGPVCHAELNFTRILLVLRVRATYGDTRTFVRDRIRNSPSCNIKAVFLYGKFLGEKRKQFQAIIGREKELYGDVLQFDNINDYYLHGPRAVDAVKDWLVQQPCLVNQQVAFGTFQLAPEKLYHAKQYGKEEENWELDNCLKFALFKQTNIQFFAHYFPPLRTRAQTLRSNELFNQTSTFELQDGIVSPHLFPYLLEPAKKNLCGGALDKKYLGVIAVHSSANNFVNRKLIRETWGNPANLAQYKFALLFFIARNDSKAIDDDAMLRDETEQYQDIIQEDFPDQYNHMTFKQIAVLKYLTEKCSNLNYNYLFKTDDDIVMDLRSISRYLKTLPQTAALRPRRAIFCFHLNGPALVPRYIDKWYVSPEEYPDRLYPAYCSGGGYLITKDLVPLLYETSLHVQTFWVDDTYVSGMLPKALGDVTVIQIPKQNFFTVKALYKGGEIGQQMLVHVMQNLDLFEIYWKMFQVEKAPPEITKL